MVKRIEFNIKYKGKTYKRVSDFARDAGVDTHLVLMRLKNGWTDPQKLAQPPIEDKDRKNNHPAYVINYKNVKYSSLAEFSRTFKLSYNLVLRCWHTGYTEPEDIIQRAKPKSLEETTQDMLAQKKIDEKAKNKYLRELGLFSPTDISQATGVPLSKIISAISGLIRNDARRTKSNISSIGIHREDITLLTDNEKTLDTISNSVVVPRYGIKPIAIKHIQVKQNYLKSLNLIQVPHFTNYYYDIKGKRIWSLNKGTTMREIKPKSTNTYILKRDKHSYSVSTKDIDDWSKNPNIEYDDLLSYADLTNILEVSKSWWSNNGIRQTIMPKLHKRYNFQTHKAKTGFAKNELITAFKKNSKTKKFITKIR